MRRSLIGYQVMSKVCGQRQFVKEPLPLYKYTYNVNCGKTVWFLINKSYTIYNRYQPLSKGQKLSVGLYAVD
jgi:hypothetical protein